MANNLTNSVHIFLAHKGGVGKTTMAALFSEWLLRQKTPPIVFDADAKNVSSCISQYGAFNARQLKNELLTIGADGNERISSAGFTTLLESLFSEEGPHVIDVGANSYIQWLDYMRELDLAQLLAEHGKTLYIHTIVSGGEMTRECSIGATEISTKLPSAKMVIWLNQPNALAYMGGKNLYLESPEYKAIDSKVVGVVTMNPLTDLSRDATSVLSTLHMLSYEMKSNGGLITMQRALSYQGWARQAFTGLDKVFGDQS